MRCAEVVHRHLQVRRLGAGGQAPVAAQQLARGPVGDVHLDVEQRAGIGLDADVVVRRHAQHERQHALQATVGAGADVERVHAAAVQERGVDRRALAPRGAVGVGPRDAFAEAAEDAQRVQCAQVQPRDPGVGQQLVGQRVAERLFGDALRALGEVGLVLQRRDRAQRRHDRVEAAAHAALVVEQARIEFGIDERVLAALPRRGHAHRTCRQHAGPGGRAQGLLQRVASLERVHVGSPSPQARAPPETVIVAPRSVLPDEPVTGLGGTSARSTCSRKRIALAPMPRGWPRCDGLRTCADAPSVPVTRWRSAQASPLRRGIC
jgi:hypothetical protein